MRFICEKCEVPMDFEKEKDLSKESMKITFCCYSCDAKFSMVTNPGETQLIYSLGIKIGEKEKSKPLEITQTTLKGKETESEQNEQPVWTPEAEKRLNNVPVFVKPIAKKSIEKLAREKGCKIIDDALMDEARGKFMGG